MPDRLVANSEDAYLSPWGAVNRLKPVFAYVEADGEEGSRYVLKTIQRLKAARSPRQADHDRIQWLDLVKNRALFVCFGDNAGSDLALLSTHVIPGMPLEFEYASVTHERAVQYLLERCATALGYEIRKYRESWINRAIGATTAPL